MTISIKREFDHAVWSDFGYENNLGDIHDAPLQERVWYKDVGPFEFQFQQYESALLNAVAQKNLGHKVGTTGKRTVKRAERIGYPIRSARRTSFL